MTKKERVRRLAEAGLIAAMYAALTVAVTPIAYGPVQFRISEVLTILPVFTPAAIPGLTVGCFVANLFGLMSGANPAGAWDLLLGPLATLLAALAGGLLLCGILEKSGAARRVFGNRAAVR